MVVATLHALLGKLLATRHSVDTAREERNPSVHRTTSAPLSAPVLPGTYAAANTVSRGTAASDLPAPASTSAVGLKWLSSQGGKIAASIGGACVGLLAFGLVIPSSSHHLIGMGYVVVFLPMILFPPQLRTAPAAISGLHGSSGKKHVSAAVLPWLFSAVAALYCAVDVVAQYGCSALHLLRPDLFSEEIVALLRGLVGLDPAANGRQLALRLLRPVLLLMALQLCR